MTYKECILHVSDNSGIIYVKYLNTYKNVRTKYTFILGEIIVVVPRIIDFSKKLRKRRYLGIVVGLKLMTKKSNGLWYKFFRNRILLLNEQLKFLGTRVKGPISRKLRVKKNKIIFKRIISYSRGTF